MPSIEAQINKYTSRPAHRRNRESLQKYMDLAIVSGNPLAISQINAEVEHAISTFGNHYSHEDAPFQTQAASELIPIFRSNPQLSPQDSAQKLLGMKRVGLHMALEILKNVDKVATSPDSFSPERQKRLNSLQPIENGEAYPFSQALWAFDREAYLSLAMHLGPYAIAELIGVPIEVFAEKPEYGEIWEAAKNMLPPNSNPYADFLRNRKLN